MKILKTYKLFENDHTGISIDEHLSEIIRSGDIEQFKELLKIIDINYQTQDFKSTPLMFAVGPVNTDMLKFIINSGADLNMVDIDGETALMRVDRNINAAIILIEAGADMRIKNNDNMNFIEIMKYLHYGKMVSWLETYDAQKLILTKEPLMYKSFKKWNNTIHPRIIKEMPHLETADDLNLL